MAAWSEISIENFRSGFIWDAEHYHPDRLLVEKQLYSKDTDVLNKYVSIISDVVLPNPVYASYDLTEALDNFLAKEGTIGATSAKKIGCPGDVIISRLRSYLEEVCLLPNRPHRNIYQLSTEFVVLRSKNGEPVSWVLPFLLSRQVQTVLKWAQTGSNHPRFRAEELLCLPIKHAIQHIIPTLNDLIKDASKKYEQALNYYPEAEAELLERLGWETLQKKSIKLSYVEDFSSIANAGRFDSEYFNPVSNRVRYILQKKGARSVSDICDFVQHGIQPEYIEGGDIGIVSQRQFRSSGLDLDSLENFTDETFIKQNPSFLLKQSDVLTYCVSAGEYLGRTFLFDSDIRCVAASFVTVLRTKRIIPGYLALFLNSPFGLVQSNMFKRGTSPFYLYPRDLKNVLVAIPCNQNGTFDLEWQKRLAAKVKASIAAKQKARQQLEEAKRLVEEALKPAKN